MNTQQLADERYRARTDLYWLCTDILGYQLVPEVHRPITDFFIKKDPAKSLYEQDAYHSRLLLDPRYHYKTTIDSGDIIQWLLNFPECRILIQSGTVELTVGMLRVIKNHFLFNERLRALFPEYALTAGKNDGTAMAFTVPCRTSKILREGSVTVATARSVKAGSHYDIMKFDDVVDELNSKTPEGLQKTIDSINDALPLLDPKGYKDFVGTRYDHADAYGWILDHDEELVKQGLPREYKVSIRKAIEVDKYGRFSASSPILFPQKFSYQDFLSIKAKDPYKFSCQYLQDPTPEDLGGFTEEMINSAMLPFKAIAPLFRDRQLDGTTSWRTASVYITWDLASSGEASSDYRAGAVGLFDKLGRLFIVDLAVGRYNSFELVNKIVELAMVWKTCLGRVGIEKAQGAEHLLPSLVNVMQRVNYYFDIDWIKTSPKKIKPDRILALAPLIKQKQLFFNKDIKDIDLLVKQFTRYRPRTRGHDDIPDAISRLMQYKNSVDTVIVQPTVDTPMFEYALPGGSPLGGGYVA